MLKMFRPRNGWGPASARAALSITFDNLGEAAELEMGIWDGRPVGTHHTASFIPKLIAALGDVRTTYFIEASNTALYPRAILAWHEAGHEVALHAWRHENWKECPPESRRALLRKSLDAMQALGIDPVGFRPPGGAIPMEAWREFEEAGLLYCSELGMPGVAQVGNMFSLPFEWSAVDVYMIEDVMAPMRKRQGDPEQPFSLATWRTGLDAALMATLDESGHRTVIFHPNFLGTSEEKLDVVRHLIASAKAQKFWIAPMRDVVQFAADEIKHRSKKVA